MDFKEFKNAKYEITLLESQLDTILDCIEYVIHDVYCINDFYNLSKDEQLKKDILKDLWYLINSYKKNRKIKSYSHNIIKKYKKLA